MSDYPRWQETFRIQSYDIGSNGLLRLDALCNFLQESAGGHARELGVAVEQLLRHNTTWVLSRLHVKIHRVPGWRQQLRIHTWPAQVDRRYAVRDFELYIEEEKMATATTAWLFIDLERKRPIRLPDDIAAFHPNPPVRALADPFSRLPVPEQVDHETVVQVYYRDLDLNRHTNNVSYVSYCLEALPEPFLHEHAPTELEIEFRNESRRGDRLLSRATLQTDGDRAEVLHQLVHEVSGLEICRAITRWQRR